jgi:hypothetical protein
MVGPWGLEPQTSTVRIANMSLGGSGSDDGNCGNVNSDALHKAICGSIVFTLKGNFDISEMPRLGKLEIMQPSAPPCFSTCSVID